MKIDLPFFTSQLDQLWNVALSPDATIQLRIESVTDNSRSAQEASFSVSLRGVDQPQLSQGTYHFFREALGFDMFITPIATDSSGIVYEAVFCCAVD